MIPYRHLHQILTARSTGTGILMMCLSMGLMTCLASLARFLMETVHPFQLVLMRNVFAFLCILPFLKPLGWQGLKTQRPGAHFSRSLIGIVSMLTWFWALAHLPFAEAIALSFTTPLFATIGAALILKEKVHIRRWSAVAVGFIGVMIMLRPDTGNLNHAALVVLFSSVLMACSTLLIKSLADTEPVRVMLFYMGVFMIPLSLPAALWVWEPMTATEWALCAVMGGIATLAHITLNRAFALAEASAVQPFDFIRLPLSALVGYFVFHEVPTWATWVGGSVILLSSVYVAHREALHARRRNAGARLRVERELQDMP